VSLFTSTRAVASRLSSSWMWLRLGRPISCVYKFEKPRYTVPSGTHLFTSMSAEFSSVSDSSRMPP
jgi:hypothetical protein